MTSSCKSPIMASSVKNDIACLRNGNMLRRFGENRILPFATPRFSWKPEWASKWLQLEILIRYVIIWQGSLQVNPTFWLVLSWSGFCHTDSFHRNGRLNFEAVKSKARVPYNKLLTNLASSSRTGEYLYDRPRCAQCVLPARPRANIPQYGPRARLSWG